MSAELIGIIGAAIALAGLVLAQSSAMRGELTAIRGELREATRERAELRDRLARLEGLLDGLLRRYTVVSETQGFTEEVVGRPAREPAK